MRRALVIAVILAGGAVRARAEPVRVIVREGDTPLAITRLRGQIADLAIDTTFAPGGLEPTLEAQIAAADRLAGDASGDGARAVVWFVARGLGLDVAVATPADHRLFVRSIPADDPSAVAEAAAVAARGALRAIAMGGTIGVELPPAPPRLALEAEVGWQVALDGGADAGAHALAQRTAIARGPWAYALELSLGPPLGRTGDVKVELSRSGAALAIERRVGGGVAIGAFAGAVVYHRATISSPTGLTGTPSTFTPAFAIGPELRWRWRPGHAPIAVEATAAVEVVAGAPELDVMDASGVRAIGTLRALQPRFGLSLVAGLP